jgi:hypothetical protein
MTPREKAEEITLLYYNLGKHLYVPISFAKQCALIAVNELIEIACDYSDYDETVTKEYWEKVKIEIENL